jgi:DNA-binding MarR family transcriptional regulator
MSALYTPEDIAGATRRLDIAMSRLNIALAREIGVSVPELLAIEHLDEGSGLGPSELARRLQLTSGSVTALVDRLEASGNAVRTPHPSDRRRVIVRRTAQAAVKLDTGVAPLTDEVLALAQSLSEAERAVVGGFLDRFVRIVEQTAEEACAA